MVGMARSGERGGAQAAVIFLFFGGRRSVPTDGPEVVRKPLRPSIPESADRFDDLVLQHHHPFFSASGDPIKGRANPNERKTLVISLWISNRGILPRRQPKPAFQPVSWVVLVLAGEIPSRGLTDYLWFGRKNPGKVHQQAGKMGDLEFQPFPVENLGGTEPTLGYEGNF